MDTKTKLLINLLDCGSLDIDKLVEIVNTCEDFNKDALYDSIEDMKNNNVDLTINSLMFELLDNLRCDISAKIEEELNIELFEDDFDIFVHYFGIFVNYLDTHITYTGEDEKVKNWLENNCELVEF